MQNQIIRLFYTIITIRQLQNIRDFVIHWKKLRHFFADHALLPLANNCTRKLSLSQWEREIQIFNNFLCLLSTFLEILQPPFYFAILVAITGHSMRERTNFFFSWKFLDWKTRNNRLPKLWIVSHFCIFWKVWMKNKQKISIVNNEARKKIEKNFSPVACCYEKKNTITNNSSIHHLSW